MTAPNRARGIALMVGAGLCWSSGGLIVRALSTTDTWTIVFWRSLFMGLFVATILGWRHGADLTARVRAIGLAGAGASACLALQIYCFILALGHTSTANTFLLMSVAPLTTAAAGALFLHERVGRVTWACIALALAGIAVMFGAGAGEGGQWLGNLFALGVPLAYAAQILFVRGMRRTGAAAPDLLPTILVAGVFAALPALLLAQGVAAPPRDIMLLALMGSIQLGLGCWLMTLAVPHLRAAEMGLLALIEPILAPVWVWLGVGEVPCRESLAGGALILAALVVNGRASLRAGS
jgi:drug/metabolite transporter (DMT)-like permease